MTTIAFDGETLASDSRVTGEFIDQKGLKKIYRIKMDRGDIIVGFAGNVSVCLKFIEMLKGNLTPDQIVFSEDEDFTALVYVEYEHKLYFYDKQLYPIPTGIPSAIGSGSGFAMGAMMFGATAVQALKIACKLDETSGPPIQQIRVKPKK